MMLPFAYVEFYDVPRYIVLRHRERTLLLQSAFNDELDEYDERYAVFRMADSIEELAKAGQWNFLSSADRELVGELPVTSVIFDPTRRKSLASDSLDALAAR